MARQNSDIESTANQDSKPADVNAETIETVANKSYGAARDRAGQLLKDAGHSVVVTPADNKRILRKIDLAILPIILIVYCLQFLDKSTLSYASVFGILEDANLHGDQYSWLGAVVYVAQLVWQPVIAYLLVKFPIGKFCAVMVFCWGAILCCMAATDDFGGLMATRFLLGSFEASVAPTFIAIVQMWYRRSEQTNRNAAWYSMLGVVTIFGSLLSYGLGHIHSGVLYSYQIIFLFCGLLTVVFSTVIFIFLPDSPMQARFLKGDDKLLAIERLRMNQMGVSSGVWRWDHVKECLLDLKTWIWFSMLTAIAIPSGGISTFGPLIIEAFGYSQFETILFNMPFGAVQLIATLGAAFAATRWRSKSPFIAILCVPPIIGISVMLNVEYNAANKGVLLFAYYIISVYPAISPLIYSWSGQNTGGDTKRKMLTAVLFIGQSAGNIVGPHLYRPDEAPHYTRGLRSNLALFIAIIVLTAVGAFWIRVLNKKHAATREGMGKSASVVDLSMENKKGFAVNDDPTEDGVPTGGVGDKAFDDVTDLLNEDFIYVY